MTTLPLRLIAATGMAFLLASCGSATGPTPGQGSDGSAGSSDADAATSTGAAGETGEVVASGIVMQRKAGEEPMFCVGAVAESYPPQCSGPLLEGEFSWDDVKVEKASGVTWTEDAYFGVGRLDLEAGDGQGVFTLTRPLSQDAPDGFTPPEAGGAGFPQLCDDPTADVADVDQAERTSSGKGQAEEQKLMSVAQGLEGYVTMWLSDGGPTMNVLLNEDADLEAARARMREVFSGPLCVEQRDLPSEKDVMAAQEALSSKFEELHLTSSGAGGVSGLLEVEVLLADQKTVDGVHEAVAEWLTPEQVQIASVFKELGSN